MKQCCICGKILPNKYAIGGACEHPNCSDVFCRYHWSLGHRKCLNHGGTREIVEVQQKKEQELPQEDNAMNETNETPQAQEPKSPSFMDRLTSGVKSIKKALIKDPQEELNKYENALKGFEEKRERLIAELDEVDRQIIAKKKQYATAPAFRKTILKAELERLITLHSNYERRIQAILTNEKNISSVISRTMEKDDILELPVKEKDVDKLIDKLEIAVDDSIGIGDAVSDLNKVNGVTSKSMDSDAFDEMLDMFGEESIESVSEQDNINTGSISVSTRETDDEKFESPLKD